MPGEQVGVAAWRPTAFWVGMSLKAGLVALLALPLLQPDLAQYEGKGMSWRVLVFPPEPAFADR